MCIRSSLLCYIRLSRVRIGGMLLPSVVFLMAAQVLLLVTLWRRDLVRPHMMLFTYIAFELLRCCVIFFGIGYGSPKYLAAWVLTLIPSTILLVAMAVQAYRRSLEHYPGLSYFSHFLLLILALTVAIAAQTSQRNQTPWGLITRMGQAVTTVLAIMSVLIAMVLPKVRRRLNCERHEKIMALYFGLVALALYAAHTNRIAWGVYLTPLSACVFLLWAAALTRAGEEIPRRPPGNSTGGPDAAEQLDALVTSTWDGITMDSAGADRFFNGFAVDRRFGPSLRYLGQ